MFHVAILNEAEGELVFGFIEDADISLVLSSFYIRKIYHAKLTC
jgi:hypothetical protein